MGVVSHFMFSSQFVGGGGADKKSHFVFVR